MVSERFLGGFSEPKTEANQKKQKNEKPHETLRGRIEFQCRLVKKQKKIKQKSMKICMFFRISILVGFWEGFGRVLGGFWDGFGMVFGGFGKVLGEVWGKFSFKIPLKFL